MNSSSVPFVTTISFSANPFTGSVNVIVYVTSLVFVIFPTFVVIVAAVGTEPSIVIVFIVSSFVFPAKSVIAFSRIFIVCSPSVPPFITILYSVSLTFVNSSIVPFVTTISFSSNPFTGSVNFIVYVIVLSFVLSPESVVIIILGLVPSFAHIA